MGEWIGENYELTGNFNDPDGDQVTISATITGGNCEPTNPCDWGTIQTSGNQWMANGAGIPDSETNSIVLIACDSWNQCTNVAHEAGATPGGSSEPVTPPVNDASDDGGGLPGFGLFAALGAIALAGIGQHRRE